MSPLQRLSNKHLLLKDNKVAPSARAKEVIDFISMYTKVNLYFATSMTIRKLKLRLSTGAPYTEAAVAADVVSKS